MSEQGKEGSVGDGTAGLSQLSHARSTFGVMMRILDTCSTEQNNMR